MTRLTDRQRQVLTLLAEGKCCKEIASHTGLSPKTVEYHRAQICSKLGMRDLAHLVRFAVGCGLVPAQEPAFEI